MTTISPGMVQRQERVETIAVFGAGLLLAVLATGFAWWHGDQHGMPELLDWQVSAFSDLGQDDQAIHSALSSASEEIGWYNYDFNTWPTPDELDEMLMPPFFKDAFWEQHGHVAWKLLAQASVNDGGATAYLGSNGTNPDQSSYLLVFQHRHLGAAYSNQSEIWTFPGQTPVLPTGYKAETLVKAGWRQVVAYRGDDEVARLKGN